MQKNNEKYWELLLNLVLNCHLQQVGSGQGACGMKLRRMRYFSWKDWVLFRRAGLLYMKYSPELPFHPLIYLS